MCCGRSLYLKTYVRLLLTEAKWNATGTMRQLWATPVLEYDGLFSDEQLTLFTADVRSTYAAFLLERSDPTLRRGIRQTVDHSSTPSDKDRLNEEFYNYQTRAPVPHRTLETVWQAFVFACGKYLMETGTPPLDYQRETAEGGALEWTRGGVPRREGMYCWGSVQYDGVHHDTHTHQGSALAGTLYMSVPDDGGALFLVAPRGAMPPFQWTYRIRPKRGNMVIFPATVPHGVHSTVGTEPRVSISCNHPGDWQKFTNSRTVFQESTWTHEMMSREDVMAAKKLAKERKKQETASREDGAAAGKAERKKGWSM